MSQSLGTCFGVAKVIIGLFLGLHGGYALKYKGHAVRLNVRIINEYV